MSIKFYQAPTVSFALVAITLALASGPDAHAQGSRSTGLHLVTSSSSSLPSSSSSSAGGASAVQLPARRAEMEEVHTRPFSTLAIRPKAGSEGVGLDLITPLTRRINLRGGFSLYSGGINPTIADVDVVSHFHLASGSVEIDLHPFRNGFRISPGITLFNDNHITGSGIVPVSSTISFNGTEYASSPSDPMVATSTVVLGSKIGPRLTMGWGNFIPHRRGSHFSMPFEIGAQYVGPPTITLGITGSACDAQGNCGSLSSDPDAQINIKAEAASLNAQYKRYSVLPIVSMGVSYKF